MKITVVKIENTMVCRFETGDCFELDMIEAFGEDFVFQTSLDDGAKFIKQYLHHLETLAPQLRQT